MSSINKQLFHKKESYDNFGPYHKCFLCSFKIEKLRFVFTEYYPEGGECSVSVVIVKAEDPQADSVYLYERHIHGGIPVGCLCLADIQRERQPSPSKEWISSR